MLRYLKFYFAAFSVFAICSSAIANDGMCRGNNDRKVPDKTTMCRSGTVWVCDMGEWKIAGGSCSA
jgi:hypothetical protein